MLAKLEKVPIGTDDDEKIPDISLLAPEQQDRVLELFAKLGDPSDPNWCSGISDVELKELDGLIDDLPWIGMDNPFAGPDLNIPDALEFYWRWGQPARGWRHYSFFNLKCVQKVRFVELCVQYGYEEGMTSIELKQLLLPLNQWEKGDQIEMLKLLDATAEAQSP